MAGSANFTSRFNQNPTGSNMMGMQSNKVGGGNNSNGFSDPSKPHGIMVGVNYTKQLGNDYLKSPNHAC